MKKFINILIFLFIFALYLITFLMIYDNFRERKLNGQEKDALELFENKIERKKKKYQKIKHIQLVIKDIQFLGRIRNTKSWN